MRVDLNDAVEEMALFTAKYTLEEVGVRVREFKNVNWAEGNLTAFDRVDLKLVHTSAVKMVVVDLVSS